MFRSSKRLNTIQVAGIFCLLSLPSITSAQVITSVVTNIGSGTFRYNYTIANNTANDLFDVAIHVQPSPGSIFNIKAPAGFTASPLDSGLGLVDFLENSSSFTATPLSGFTYDSTLAPRASTYDANIADLSTGNITTVSGATTAALNPAAVPEPGTVALLGAFGAASCAAFFNRRRARRV